MKKLLKILSIIAIVAVTGFSMAGCSDGSSSGGGGGINDGNGGSPGNGVNGGGPEQTVTQDGITYTLIDEAYYRVTAADPALSGDITILSTISGLPVTEIADASGSPLTGVFEGNTTITGVSATSVTSIGNRAFMGCTSLTTASFSVATSIGIGAFYSCTSLTTVSFPAATSIGNSAFNNCASLTTASFPAATSIGNSAFNNCTSLTTVSFPAAATIGDVPFIRCTSLTNFILIGAGPLSVAEGGKALVRDSTELIAYPAASGSITMDNIISINQSVFDGCRTLSTVSFPAAVSIGRGAFWGCTSLTSANFPAAASIGGSAFASTGNDFALTVTLVAAPPTVGRTLFFNAGYAKTVTVRFPSSGSAAYGPAPTNTTDNNWGNAFRGKGWDGTAYDAGTVNTSLILVYAPF